MKKMIIIISLFSLILILLVQGNPIFPQNVATYEARACRYLAKGEIDNAIEILEAILKSNPDNLNAIFYMGIASFLNKDLADAYQRFEKVEKELERMVGASRPMGDPTMFAEMARDRRSGVLFSEDQKGLLYFCRGITLMAKKDLKNAEKRFKNAQKLEYDKTSINLQLIDLYIKKKDIKAAAKQLAEYKQAKGEDELHIFLDGYLKSRNKKFKEALAAFEKVDPSNLDAKKNIACLHYNSGDYQKALEIWQEILSQNEGDKDAQICIGRAYFHLGDSAKAQEFFTQAGITISPDRYSPKTIQLVYASQLQDVRLDIKCK